MGEEVGLQLEACVVGPDVDAHDARSCRIAGVDGVPGGWVVAVVSPGLVEWSVQPHAAAVLAATRGCTAVGVDIPLGLPAGRARRACDTLAATRLGRARSSVFPAPPREVLAAPDYAQACAVARRLTGRAISLQTFHITPKIAEWDAVALPDRVVEVHPELALRALAPEDGLRAEEVRPRRGPADRGARALGGPGGRRWATCPPGARLDDVLDALAVSLVGGAVGARGGRGARRRARRPRPPDARSSV